MSATETPDPTVEDIDLSVIEGEEEIAAAVELTEALSGAVRKAVNSQVSEAAQLIAKGVVDKVLTEPVAEEMRVAAVRDAIAAVDANHPGEDPVAKLRYRNLELFVSKFIAQLYRRDVIREGTQKTARWCPQWWDHGEAVARLGALWRSFERMRQGDGVEMSVWWLHHADPMMERLLDINGPFRWCSVPDGHVRRLQALPVVEIPEALKFPDGYDFDEVAPSAAVSGAGLYLPSAPLQARRVIRAFP